MRLLLCIALSASGLLAQRTPLVLGFTPATPTASATCAMGATTNWCALGFVNSFGDTLSAVRVYFSAVTSTPTMTADLYNDDGTGLPGTSIDGPRAVTVAVTAAGSADFAGFTTVLTAGTQYHIVFKNTTGSTSATLRHGANSTAQGSMTNSTGRGWTKHETANSGTAWATAPLNNVVGLRLEFSNGGSHYDGIPFTSFSATGTGSGIFGAAEGGVLFATPAGPTINVAGISMYISAVAGTPTGNLSFKIYTGSSTTPGAATAETLAIPVAQIGSGWRNSYFATPVAIPAGTTIRVVACTTGADSSANRFDLGLYFIDNTAPSKALLPFAGTTKWTWTADGTTFVDTDTQFVPVGLILDATPFTVTAGGGTRVYPH